jgi:ribulose-5-phosphate 4-epimerase/fuculose-1-phosphate aldolase
MITDEIREAPVPGRVEVQRAIATACRILAHRGLMEDVLGHVSVRSGDGLMVRSRGAQERGLLFTTPDEVRHVSGDGLIDDPAYSPPNELPIHTAVLAARCDVRVVVHAHPPAVVALDLAGLALRPIVGAYNIPASRMAAEGIPTYPRSVLVNTDALGRELAEALGDKPACLMRGHGIITVGTTLEQAVSRALAVDSLARMTLRAARHGVAPASMSEEDLAQLPDLGSGFNDGQMWRFNVELLRRAGIALD